jgi:hypothetical protein
VLRIFNFDYLKVVPKRIEQIKALAIGHRDGFPDFRSLLLQISSNRGKVLYLHRDMTIFRGLGPGRSEVDMQQDIHPFIPDQVIDLVERTRPLHFLETEYAP